MRSHRSPFASRHHHLSTILHQPFARGWRRQALCLVLIFGMLIVPDAGYAISHASELAMQVAKDTVAPVPVAVKWVKRLLRRSATPPRQETTADRNANVTSINITPAKIVGYIGQQISFSAVGRNAAGVTIQGAQFTWSASDADKLQIDNSGTATFSRPGLVWLSGATSSPTATRLQQGRWGQARRQAMPGS